MKYADGCPPASYDAKARVALYDEWGVTAGVVFPTIGILPFPCDDNDLATAYCRAYNTWQSEFSADAGGRVLPIAHVNLADLDGAIAELERCLALGFKGVFVAPEPIDGIRPGDPHFDPFWQRCAEAGIPACLHVVVRFGGAGVPYAPWLMAGAGMVFGFSLGAPGQIIPAIASMLLDGVFDRVPTLKVLCVEAGCGWAAHLMDRLDEKYELLSFMQAPPLRRRPSEYLQQNVWYVAEPDERSIDAMLDLVGEDRILWGSDFPHIDSKMEAPNLIRQSIRSLNPQRQAAVLGANAAAVFGL
jgi:predicted TIM-barrel fold metal-dependent hydrolase